MITFNEFAQNKCTCNCKECSEDKNCSKCSCENCKCKGCNCKS